MTHRVLGVSALSLLAACSSSSSSVGPGGGDAGSHEAGSQDTGSPSPDSGSGQGDAAGDVVAEAGGGDGPSSACTLTAGTAPTGAVHAGCAMVTRDTSACQASRTAAGLSGFWLKFSCRVTLTAATSGGVTSVTAASDGRPDHESNYFPSSDPCHVSYTPSFPDPNQIATHSLALTVPLVPQNNSQAMGLGAVGMAVDGSAIFDNQAAPGDDIFKEAGSFDQCQGHPAPGGQYHYHSEPYSISYDDDAFIGVLRDGNPLYGRRDADGSTPKLDASGGHTGTTPDSPSTPVYHYHVNLQTSTASGTAGQQQWFLTTGTYAGRPGTCSGC